jgi:hypothetical protein
MWRYKRLLLVATIAVALALGLLEGMRYWAEHRSLPVSVIVQGPPIGPMADQMKAAGITNIGIPVPYEEVTNPPITLREIKELKRCLARDRFLPLFPPAIEVRDGEVTAPYYSKSSRYTVVSFGREKEWRIISIEEHHMTVCYIQPPTRWEKILSYLPFVD